MRDFEDSPDFGRVITGSSNFSKSGLVNNLEFNVELKNSSDINFALEKFHSKFPNTYGGKVKKGKIIIKGMTLLDAMIDFKGEYIPGKSTMIIEIDDKKMLKFIAALINSKVSAFYINEKYSSSTYNGGVTFNKKMINSLPIMKNYKDIIDKCVEIVDKILDNSIELEEGQAIIDNIIFKEFNLNEKEIEIIKKTLEKHKNM